MGRRSNIVPIAVAFEAGLGMLAVGLAYWLDVPLRSRITPSVDALLVSLAGLVPLLVMLALATRTRWRLLANLTREVTQLTGSLFGHASWGELAVVSIAAGVGEELLFRGSLQPWAARWLGEAGGIAVISLLFGALHAASTSYFVLATLVGLYLGWLTSYFGDLAAPMAIHAAYDFVALLLLLRRFRRTASLGNGVEQPTVDAAADH